MNRVPDHPGGDANPMNSLEYKLERLATKLHRAGDLGGAIAALERANAVGGDVGTRLAKYMQAAGRYEDALVEIKRLEIQRLAWVTDNMAHKTQAELDEARASEMMQLYADAALIASRQRDTARAAEFRLICAQHRAKVEALRPINETQRKQNAELLRASKGTPALYRRLLRAFYPGRPEGNS